MDRATRIDHHIAAIGAALELAQTSYLMLLDDMADDQPEHGHPGPLRASDNPDVCEHPRPTVLDVNPPHLMCPDCGLDMGPQFINGG